MALDRLPDPPVLHEPSPRWAEIARTLVAQVRRSLAVLPRSPEFRVEHIGSTSVPGLAAKPIIDLQVRMPTLPTVDELARLLKAAGFEPALGARPDSPGVFRDLPRGSAHVSPEVWEKRTFRAPSVPAHLHIRRSDSPWADYTVWFRDWLIAHPEQRNRYEREKRRLAALHAADRDQDDYTRAKTAFFDQVQAEIEAWGGSRQAGPPDRSGILPP